MAAVDADVETAASEVASTVVEAASASSLVVVAAGVIVLWIEVDEVVDAVLLVAMAMVLTTMVEGVDTVLLLATAPTIGAFVTAATFLPRIALIGADPGKKETGMVGIAIDTVNPRPTVISSGILV